jgi:hypothetical protein
MAVCVFIKKHRRIIILEMYAKKNLYFNNAQKEERCRQIPIYK